MLNVTVEDSQKFTDDFDYFFKKLNVKREGIIAETKMKIWKNNLWKLVCNLLYLLEKLLAEITYLFIYYGESIAIITLK